MTVSDSDKMAKKLNELRNDCRRHRNRLSVLLSLWDQEVKKLRVTTKKLRKHDPDWKHHL